MLKNAGENGPVSVVQLRARFATALCLVGASSDGGVVFDDLVARYGQAHRHYHTLEHVDACLAWLDWLTAHAQQPAEVELAIWFHDAIYDPHSSDNEAQSAELARTCLRLLGVPNATIQRIADHVLATAQHTASSPDAQLVNDIDLTILGAKPQDFERFEQQIRHEYSHVPEAAYKQGRSRVLNTFLQRPRLYINNTLYDLLEPRARLNLERRIVELSNEGGRATSPG